MVQKVVDHKKIEKWAFRPRNCHKLDGRCLIKVHMKSLCLVLVNRTGSDYFDAQYIVLNNYSSKIWLTRTEPWLTINKHYDKHYI